MKTVSMYYDRWNGTHQHQPLEFFTKDQLIEIIDRMWEDMEFQRNNAKELLAIAEMRPCTTRIFHTNRNDGNLGPDLFL